MRGLARLGHLRPMRAGGLLLLAALGTIGALGAGAAGLHANPANGSGPSNCSSGLSLYTSQVSGAEPLAVTFQLTIYWGTPASVQWNFGDGSFYNVSGSGALEPTHVYTVVGNFQATASVTSDSRTGVCTQSVVVSPPALTVTASASAYSGIAPFTVTFHGSISNGTGTFSYVGWNFGDGRSAPGDTLTYTYTQPGQYHPVFSAIDSDGAAANATLTIEVASATPGAGGSFNVGTASLVGVLAIVVAVFAGALLYVRAHSLPFSDGDGDEPGARSPPPEIVPTAPVEIGTGTGTAIVPTAPLRYAPEAYRSVFLDLSDREFDVLADPGESVHDLAVAPPSTLAGVGGQRTPRGRLSHRVVLHLASLPRLAPDDIPTGEFTQAGMVDALGMPQSLLSNVLRRLTYSGILTTQVEHVQGSPRRLNVYRLTAKGEQLGAKLKKAAAAATEPAETAGEEPASDGEP